MVGANVCGGATADLVEVWKSRRFDIRNGILLGVHGKTLTHGAAGLKLEHRNILENGIARHDRQLKIDLHHSSH